ncbi:hypothetical protein BC628DRAFT_1419932 [Trametes gibbosa]|nr:hypothetical protein BC628DRAFT_1419932 [Trametes gibbosa]
MARSTRPPSSNWRLMPLSILDHNDDPIWPNSLPPSSHYPTLQPVSFSSAVSHSESSPAKRRHGSDGALSRARTDHDRWAAEAASSHVRARTLDDPAPAAVDSVRPSPAPRRLRKDASQHPLRAPGLASSSALTLDHHTRPSMRKILTLHDAHDGRREGTGSGEEGTQQSSASQDREMLVIVHQVLPTDSLAGVALKYGISLAELRRTNQLWASDTVHLRNSLYIPVDKARHVRHLKTALVDSDAQPDHPDATPSGPGPPQDGKPRPGPSGAETYTLRRVPASQLSYFPPPTNPPDPPRSGGLTSGFAQTMPNRRPPPSGRPHMPDPFARAREPPLQGVLDALSTSLHATAHQLRAYAQSQSSRFAALPIRPAGSLASRRSLESNSATTASSASASEDVEWEHELEDIGPRAGSGRARRTGAEAQAQAGRVRPRGGPGPGVLRGRGGASRSSGAVGEGAGAGEDGVELESAPFAVPVAPLRSSVKPRGNGSSTANGHAGTGRYAVDAMGWEEGPPAKVGVGVRTAQLEPSPGMQLPALQGRRSKMGQQS